METVVLVPEEKTSSVLERDETAGNVSSNPWGNANKVESGCPNFSDVMSEDLARNLSLEEGGYQNLPFDSNADFNVLSNINALCEDNADHVDDYALAKMLQSEYDKEYNLALGKEEKKFNGNCKVSVSYGNFRKNTDEESTSSDDDDYYDEFNGAPDSFDKRAKRTPTVGKSGIIKHANGRITTKHDPEICGRRNATKVMHFPPGIKTGDGGGFDMVLSNKVYNNLKAHSQAENKRQNRLHDKKEKSTAEQSLDPRTRLIIYKLVNAEVLKSVSGCISTGKEACVFHGYGGQLEGKQVPNECALKVYKTTLNEFMTRDKYIVDDFRFKDRFSKQNPRKVIKMWAEKEYHNLVRLCEANIPCPTPVVLKKNVLVMSFIGTDYLPASKLKDVSLSLEKWHEVYSEVFNIMKTMYSSCNLVHADFSEYNLLWHCNKVWVIDVSQSVEPTHCNALQFLLRDCQNIHKFFERKRVNEMKNPVQMFCDITGMDFPDENIDLLNAIERFEKNRDTLTRGYDEKSEAFDYIFKTISKGTEKATKDDD